MMKLRNDPLIQKTRHCVQFLSFDVTPSIGIRPFVSHGMTRTDVDDSYFTVRLNISSFLKIYIIILNDTKELLLVTKYKITTLRFVN